MSKQADQYGRVLCLGRAVGLVALFKHVLGRITQDGFELGHKKTDSGKSGFLVAGPLDENCGGYKFWLVPYLVATLDVLCQRPIPIFAGAVRTRFAGFDASNWSSRKGPNQAVHPHRPMPYTDTGRAVHPHRVVPYHDTVFAVS